MSAKRLVQRIKFDNDLPPGTKTNLSSRFTQASFRIFAPVNEKDNPSGMEDQFSTLEINISRDFLINVMNTSKVELMQIWFNLKSDNIDGDVQAAGVLVFTGKTFGIANKHYKGIKNTGWIVEVYQDID